LNSNLQNQYIIKKQHLPNKVNIKIKKNISRLSILQYILNTRIFFQWLINKNDLPYYNPYSLNSRTLIISYSRGTEYKNTTNLRDINLEIDNKLLHRIANNSKKNY